MKQFFPRIPVESLRLINTGNKMKRSMSRLSLRSPLALVLISFVAAATLITFVVSASRNTKRADAPQAISAVSKSNTKPLTRIAHRKTLTPMAPFAPTITATLADDIGLGSKKNPGDTITYTAVITNTSLTDALNVVYTDVLDNNTTLVGGSVKTTPIAFDDAYSVIGNVRIQPNIAQGLLANDIDPDTGTNVGLTASAGVTSTQGGNVTVNSDGSFSYNPPVGFQGSDTFTYTVTDPTGKTGTGTVTLTVSGMIWFINNNPGPPPCTTLVAGCGRLTTPFSTLASFQGFNDNAVVVPAHPRINDNIFIFESAINYIGPVTLLSGQRLFGQDSTVIPAATALQTLTGLTPQAYSDALPTMNTIGNATTITSGGVTVSLNNTTTSNNLNGFTVGASTTTGIAGTSFGTLNVGDVILNTSTGQALVLSTGTVSTPANYAGFTSTTSTGGTNNVSLTTIAGTVNLGSGALSGAGGNGFHVNGGAAGINFSGTISNSTLRQVNIINKTGGTVALSGAISGTGTGIFLNSNTPATINFTGGVVLSTSTNDAFTATGGGTVSVTGAANTLTSTTGIALNVANTTIGASGLTFRSISSNGSSSGIVLNNTGSSAGLTISGNGGSCTSAGTCTGGAIQNTSGRGISLTNTQKVSIDRIFVFTTVNSGIGGTQVVDFTLTNSKLDNNGNTTGNDFSNVGFGIDNLTTENNLSGVVVITGNTLSNSFEHGIDIQNFSGTISNATISNNTITSSTSAAVSKGSGIRLLGFGNAGSTSNITKATISGNTIMNFPGGAGITAQYGNNTSGPAGAWGTTGSAVNRIFIQNNIIQGQSAANPMNTNAILMTLTGKGQANWLADSNGTVGQPITNIGGAEIGVTIRGVNPTATCDITNNRIVGITASAAQGIAFAADFLTLTTDAPQLSGTIIGNNISGQDGEAIQVLATPGSSAHIDVSVKNNTTTAPNCGGCNRFGITAEVGSSSGTTTGAPSMCLNMSGNTAGGSGVNPGIGIRKKTAAYVFNIENFVGGGDPTAFLTGLNPAGGGVLMISQTTGFGNCATAPIAPPDDGGIAKNAPIGPVNADSSEQTQASNTTLTNGGSNASPTTFGWLKEVLHPVAAFATKLNFLQRSEVPVTPTLTPAEKSAAIAGVNGISASQTTEDKKVTPQSGGTVTVNGSGTGFTLPAGKTITITYDATVNTPPLAKSVSTQGTVTGSNFTFVNGINTTPNTDDPETVGGPPDATVTNINTTITWTGASTTDWDTAGNWNPSYIPGSGNDVVIPNVVNQPTLANSSPTINSLNIANSATLTISGQTLTISGNSGSDLTLNGVISGGALNFAGGGPHLIKNAGGTGSISSTNTTTVLSPAVVTLSNSLQMGALAINAGGSMTISGNTLSLNGPGAALSVAGTFTPAARGDDGSPGTPPGDGLQAIGSTVVFNSTTGAQTGAGITYSSLTINNSAGVTFTSDATVNGTLALTSGDLNMGASGQFTLTQPNTTASTGTGDVTGSVKRSGSPLPPAVALTFGNPDNRITFTTTTGFTDITVKLTKATPSGTFGPDPIGWPGAILRTYLITPGNTGTFTSPTLRLHYNDPADLNGNSEGGSGLKLYHYVTSPSHGWQIQSTSVMNAALNFVEQTNVPGFSPWTIANFSTTAATSTVSGRILDDNGNPVEGAVIRLNGTQNRKTITDASGNYNFFEVETNGFYTVTPSRVNYNFAPGTRGFSALGAHTEASFAGTFNGNHQNPLDTTEYFVRQQYVDFLGREPEEKGFNDWTDTINNCGAGDTSCDRVHVSEMFFRSEEFQQRGYFVYRFYSTALGRKPDFAEFTPDMARVSGFLTNDQLEAAKTAFANDFVTRPAFAQYATMTNAQYVDALSQTAGVTLGNRQVLVASLEAGTLTRAQALRQIAESGEVYAKYYNQAFVVMEYFGYLRRDPDILYLNWIDVLNQGGDSRHMVEGFVDATEYRNRFKQ